MINQNIELLAPAKNAEVGMAAIQHGADAVYIGAPKFGARSAVGNSKDEIENLVRYAHLYGAKVYVALNTILRDDEIEDAKKIICDMYNIGVDAIIVQDMGILMLDLPPISLHASTQCDVRSIEKVQFLEKCGFEQIVLARETSIDDIKNICANTSAKIEAFVHGALCVSYSGQCYMSAAYNSRSANRGECAQLCRLPYNLIDEKGNVIEQNKHLLSLKDLDASQLIEELIDAGVHSFKIEGRLKDIEYVKNITAYYRQKIDKILVNRGVEPRSKFNYHFTPDPKKTFYRGATSYFLENRNKYIASFDTPKSLGEPVGKVKDIWRNALSVSGTSEFSNGDGLCFLDRNGEFQGFRVNKVEANRLFPLKMPNIEKGTQLYRNNNVVFNKLLNGLSAERLIPINILLEHDGVQFVISASDMDGHKVSLLSDFEKQLAQNEQKTIENIKTQLSKLGGTAFVANNVTIDLEKVYFLPASVLNQWRRELVEKLTNYRIDSYKPSYTPINKESSHPYLAEKLDYRVNILNSKAKEFYIQHQSKVKAMAFELEPQRDAELMRCKHCIKYSIGQCPKENKSSNISNTLTLENSRGRYTLHFDCKNCEMFITESR